MWVHTAPNVAVYTQLKAGLGEGSPIPPLGRWERRFWFEFLTVINAFIASQKCQSLAYRQNHTTTAENITLYTLDPCFYRGRLRAREEEG